MPAPKIHNKNSSLDYIGVSHEISVSKNPYLFNVRLGS